MTKKKQTMFAESSLINMYEKLFSSIIETEGGIKHIAITLNNVFDMGVILDEVYGKCTQEALDKVYEAVELLFEADKMLSKTKK